MKILKQLNINPFLQLVWVSKEAKAVWERAVDSCVRKVWEVEVETVANDTRDCGWRTMQLAQLPEFERMCAERVLSCSVVRYSKSWQGFAHRFEQAEKIDDRTSVSVLFAKHMGKIGQFRRAFDKGDIEAQGELLGYPDCCRKFFAEQWKMGYFDPIWQVAVNTEGMTREKGTNEISVGSHPYSNPLLRYVGIRTSFHIPCSFMCKKTVELAEKKKEVFGESLKLMEAMLSMPIVYDVLWGMAVIKTPIFYIVTSSATCDDRHVVKTSGGFVPKESVA